MIEYKLKGEFIELIKLLKILGIAETGGHAKLIVEDEMVLRNGQIETRKRAKLRQGDILEVNGQKIKIL